MIALAAGPKFVRAEMRPSNSHALKMQLLRLSQTLHATHTAKILVIGSSSTVGLGATSASKTYVARLEPDLESAIAGVDFQVVGRGISGEVARPHAARSRRGEPRFGDLAGRHQ
jgi:hypothetical protein